MQNEPEHTLLLWHRFQQGDVQAFEALYRQHAPILIAYARKLTNDEHLLHDSMQELFTRLWKVRQTLTSPQNVQAYLLSSLRREVLRQLKKDLPETLHDSHHQPAEHSTEEMLIQRQQEHQRNELLVQAVKQLPARQQEAIFLKYFAHLSFQEIANVMDISIKGVYKIIYKAIDNLKENPFLQRLFGVTAIFLLSGGVV
jgi:RNA polymerase sigma factor (sigma-70 family)